MKFCKSLCLLACIVATTDCARRQEDHSMHPRQFSSVDPATVPWRQEPLPGKENLYIKALLADPQTGTGVDLVRYPAGVVTPSHTHPYGHGMYILQGKLITNHGTFGPGMFVWFPEGETIYHGATADQDAVVLFIRHEPFDIQFTDGPSATNPVPDRH
jgi:quercetin dioxygenase-like cupin family protein